MSNFLPMMLINFKRKFRNAEYVEICGQFLLKIISYDHIVCTLMPNLQLCNCKENQTKRTDLLNHFLLSTQIKIKLSFFILEYITIFKVTSFMLP